MYSFIFCKKIKKIFCPKNILKQPGLTSDLEHVEASWFSSFCPLSIFFSAFLFFSLQSHSESFSHVSPLMALIRSLCQSFHHETLVRICSFCPLPSARYNSLDGNIITYILHLYCIYLRNAWYLHITNYILHIRTSSFEESQCLIQTNCSYLPFD